MSLQMPQVQHPDKPTVCAWCEREKGNKPDPGISHGICPRHYRQLLSDYAKSKRPIPPELRPLPISEGARKILGRINDPIEGQEVLELAFEICLLRFARNGGKARILAWDVLAAKPKEEEEENE